MTRLMRGQGHNLGPRALYAALLSFAVCALHAPCAHARNLEPGRLFFGAGLGVAARLPTLLGSSPAAGQLALTGEYTLHRALSVVGDITLGMAHTNTVIGASGVRGRLSNLGLAISPFAQVELAAGGLFNVLGANVPWMGSRLGLGVDYFLTGQSTASVMLATLLGGTLKERNAFYGTVQILVSVHFGALGATKPVPSPLPVLGA